VGHFADAHFSGKRNFALLAQPALIAILAIPLLGEALFPLQVIGGILALIGIYIVNCLGR
jgi:drug/metabolite transporter (DMT)-like permease